MVLGGGGRGLVFGHERGADLCEWLPTARSYARLGYRVLVAAVRIRPAVAGVVSLSGGAVFGDLDARPAVTRLRVPALFMAARRDEPFAGAARGLYGAAGTRDKRLLVLAGDAHGTAMLQAGAEAARARAALRRLVAAHLGR